MLGPHLCAAAAGAPADRGRPRAVRADRRATCVGRAHRRRAAAPAAARLVLDRPPSGPATSPTSGRPAGRRCSWSRPAPAGCSAPSTPPRPRHRPRRRGLRAPGRDLAGARRSTSTSTSRSSSAPTRTTRPRRARSPTSRSSRSAQHRDWGGCRLSLRRRSTCPTRWCRSCSGASPAARSSARSRSTCRSASLRTCAVWWTVPADVLAEAGLAAADLPGAAHAAEHCSIGLLPLFATCDRWDIGGVSTAAAPGHRAAHRLRLRRPPRRRRVRRAGLPRRRASGWPRPGRRSRSCGCDDGCPSCIQSPKCGNQNNPLDKVGAVRAARPAARRPRPARRLPRRLRSGPRGPQREVGVCPGQRGPDTATRTSAAPSTVQAVSRAPLAAASPAALAHGVPAPAQRRGRRPAPPGRRRTAPCGGRAPSPRPPPARRRAAAGRPRRRRPAGSPSRARARRPPPAHGPAPPRRRPRRAR